MHNPLEAHQKSKESVRVDLHDFVEIDMDVMGSACSCRHPRRARSANWDRRQHTYNIEDLQAGIANPWYPLHTMEAPMNPPSEDTTSPVAPTSHSYTERLLACLTLKPDSYRSIAANPSTL